MRLIFIIYLLLFLNACKYQKALTTLEINSSKIVSGVFVDKKDKLAKSSISIVKDENSIKCTASYIQKNIILTAAHCFLNPSHILNEEIEYDPKTENEEDYFNKVNKKLREKLKEEKDKKSLYKGLGSIRGVVTRRNQKWLKPLKGIKVYLSKEYLRFLAIKKAIKDKIILKNTYSSYELNSMANRDYAIIKYSNKKSDYFIPLMTNEEVEKNVSKIDRIISFGYGVTVLGNTYDSESKERGKLKKVSLKVFNILNKLVYAGPLEEEKAGLCHGDSGGPSYFQKDDKSYIQVGVNTAIITGGCALSDGVNSNIAIVTKEDIIELTQ